jgi:hypothetical protein
LALLEEMLTDERLLLLVDAWTSGRIARLPATHPAEPDCYRH